MSRRTLPLLIACALSTLPPGCCPTRTVKVPTVVVAERPPCHLREDLPPVTDAEPFTPAWVDYYQRMVAWAWRVHRACRAVAP